MIAMSTAGRAVAFAGATVVVSMLGLLLVGIGMLSGHGARRLGHRARHHVHVDDAAAGPARHGRAAARGHPLAGPARRRCHRDGHPRGRHRLHPARRRWRGRRRRHPGAEPRRPEAARCGAPPRGQAGGDDDRRTGGAEPSSGDRCSGAGRRRSLLVVLAAPVLGLRLGWADEGNFPEDSATRQAYDLLAEGFGEGFNGPFVVTATTAPGTDAGSIDELHARLVTTPGVAAVTPPVADDPSNPAAYVMTLIPTSAPQDEATTDLVRTLRDDALPAAAAAGLDVHVTGRRRHQHRRHRLPG